MNKLLSILIILGFISVASAEEIYLECLKDGSDQVFLEIYINLEENILLKNPLEQSHYSLLQHPGDNLEVIVQVSEKYIIANDRINGTRRTKINRHTGELTTSWITSEGTQVSIAERLTCKKIEQIF